MGKPLGPGNPDLRHGHRPGQKGLQELAGLWKKLQHLARTAATSSKLSSDRTNVTNIRIYTILFLPRTASGFAVDLLWSCAEYRRNSLHSPPGATMSPRLLQSTRLAKPQRSEPESWNRRCSRSTLLRGPLLRSGSLGCGFGFFAAPLFSLL